MWLEGWIRYSDLLTVCGIPRRTTGPRAHWMIGAGLRSPHGTVWQWLSSLTSAMSRGQCARSYALSVP